MSAADPACDGTVTPREPCEAYASVFAGDSVEGSIDKFERGEDLVKNF